MMKQSPDITAILSSGKSEAFTIDPNLKDTIQRQILNRAIHETRTSLNRKKVTHIIVVKQP